MALHHPIGIQPEGMMVVRGEDNSTRLQGLGALAVLSDALMLEVLGYLGPKELAAVRRTSKALYAFAEHEDLWKGHVIDGLGDDGEVDFVWAGTWQETYGATLKAKTAGGKAAAAEGQANGMHANGVDAVPKPKEEDAVKAEGEEEAGAGGRRGGRKRAAAQAAANGKGGSNKKGRKGSKQVEAAEGLDGKPVPRRSVQVQGFYSDLLYQPWHCATCDILPEWLEVDNIDRRKGLTPAQFREQYELPNRPVLLTDGASDWAALQRWTPEYLGQALGSEHKVIAGNIPMPFSTYLKYAASTFDEMPLYLFDKTFIDHAPQLAKDFRVPRVFSEDLMQVLGDQRPDYRWLILGPARSGSSFHIDPNATSAWNAIVTGRKKWILYPPNFVPPGVHPSPDGADVATPVSLLEWFLNFYDATKESKVQPIECVAKAGEVVFVPRGWWHACLNLDTMTIAVTQNFVSSANLAQVLDFLRPGRADLVSGCSLGDRSSLHDRFMDSLKQSHPELVQKVEVDREARRKKAEESHRLACLFKDQHGAAKQPAAEAAAGHGEPSKGQAGGPATVVPAAPAAPASGGGFKFGFSL